MSVKTINVDKGYLESIADDYQKASGIIDFVSSQLLIMHDNLNGGTKHPSVTIYQLHAMLESLDGRLMSREMILKNVLGIEEE